MTLKKGKTIIFMTLFLIIGSSMHGKTKDDDIDYIRYTKEITHSFIQECEKKYDIDCIGTGGQLAQNVAEIQVIFVAHRKGSIEEARRLQVSMIEDLLNRVNTHEKIRPFLIEYPFKPHNLSISLSFQKPDDSNYTDGSVVLIFLGKKGLMYCREDPKTGKLEDIMEEPYEEALKIVFGGAPKEPQNS